MHNIFNRNKNYPFNINGLLTEKSDFDHIVCHIKVEQVPELETLQLLFRNLPEQLEIFFFDHFHPTISDPRAYVTVRQVDGNFYYWLGNHGWTSDKYWTTTDYCAKYLLKNWSFNEEILNVSLAYGNSNQSDIQKERLWTYQLTELEKSDWDYVLYEVNGNLLLSVLAGKAGLYELNIFLDDQQQKDYKNRGAVAIKQVARVIRENQNKYSEKSIEVRTWNN